MVILPGFPIDRFFFFVRTALTTFFRSYGYTAYALMVIRSVHA